MRLCPMSTHSPELKLVSSEPKRVPREPFPIVSLSIMILCALVFGAMWMVGKGDINGVASAFGAKENARIHDGEWWRLVTAMFLHGSLVHLVVNGLSLYWLGWSLEKIYGSRKYLIIYLFAGVVSFIVSYMRSPYPSLGASGAIFGLVGAGLIFPIRFRELLPEQVRSKILSQLLTTAVINLGIGFQLPGVDNWAHIGGMAGGGIMALFLIPDVLDRRPREQVREMALWAGVVFSVGILLFAGVAQWKTPKEPPLLFFTPPTANPWWQIGIPPTWVQTEKGWVTPSKGLLDVSDSLQYPLRRAELDRLLKSAKSGVSNFTKGAYPAHRVTLKIGDSLFEICVIDAKKEAVMLVLKSQEKSYPLAQQEMSQALQNLEVLHDPPPSTSAPSP